MEDETVETPKVPFFEKHASSILVVTGVLATAALTTTYVVATVKSSANQQNSLKDVTAAYTRYLEQALEKVGNPSTVIPAS